MQIQTKKPASLTQAELGVWTDIIADGDEFSSPYFHPQFTLGVAAVRDDVEVAVLSDDGHIVGFFPYQRSGNTAKPVGGMLSDAHGIIVSRDIRWSWEELLPQCGLTAWNFHYQIQSQIPEPRWHPEVDPAAVMDLRGGFDEYKKRLDSKSIVSQTDRKARKMGRECGEVRFDWNSDDEQAFQLLKQWKSQQYRESDIADVFGFSWTTNLLQTIRRHSGSEYEGLMSVLYVSDRPVAVHFGLRAGKVLHQWFPAYDPELKNYSPGVIHLLEMARHAAEHGVERIDLGRVCHYKSRVATHCVDVAEGSVDLRPVTRLLKYGYHQTFEWLRHSPLRSVARIPGRMLRRLAEQKQFQ